MILEYQFFLFHFQKVLYDTLNLYIKSLFWRIVMVLNSDFENLKHDKRVVDRFIQQSKVNLKDHNKYLENLSDLSEECEDIAEDIFSSIENKAEKVDIKEDGEYSS